MRGSLTGRMVIASVLLTLLTSAAFAVLLLAIRDQRNSAQLDRHSQEVLVAAARVERNLVDIETGTRGYLLTGDGRYLQPAHAGEADFAQASRELVDLTDIADLNEAPGRLTSIHVSGTAQAIKIKGESYIRDYFRPLVVAAERGDPAARSIENAQLGKIKFDDIRWDFNTLEQAEQRVAAERDDRAREIANRATIAAIAGLGVTVVLVGVFATYLSRAIARPVRQASVTAERLASGDLSTRMPTTGVAEIGVLEKSFNTMAGSLERSQAELADLLAEQAALRRVATVVAEGTPPEKVFPAVTEEVARLLDVDGTRLMRYEADGTATIVASWGELTIVPVGTRITLEGRNIGSLVRSTGKPTRIDDYADAPGSAAAIARERGIRSTIGAPIMVEGRLWGAMSGFITKTDAPLASGIELRLADFTDLVGTAIANAQARADLTASRARVVATTDEIRRRIERDLHDGTQQRLVSLVLELRNAQADIPDTQPELRAELADIADGLVAALDDLREISRGIHPALLATSGLGPALKVLARRSPLLVELDLDLDGRLPEHVEVAAYYVVAEALTNAAKHAHPTVIWVAADVVDGRLRLSVCDDGVGGADPAKGSGLTGLTDRVEALGGSITVHSPPGEGTAMQVWLPLSAPAEPT
ncbi:sensor histidine kinase [Pseudonocardia alaniniphila]|uniref:histidine kinase n=1 Tax=Pseudonocardia alaniniphila TaxID=75291 RepID=A0ABS9TP31_9PSEU|nr:CHASE3 domain-containing protein [Pseudonocardia alaniniphila]MCH6170295.1 CHASE3 domain-containing protein [Pseudonocardia alaniniphila]